MTSDEGRGPGGSTLHSVDDALAALEMLAERGTLTVAEVQRAFDRSRSSAYRLVRTLVDRGWLKADSNGAYVAGERTIQLGMRALGRADLRELARPWMERLTDQTQETTTLSVAIGDHRVCLDQNESPRQVRMTVALGVPFPLYAGASGRAILCGMTDAKLAEYLDSTTLVRLTSNTLTERDALLQSVVAGRKDGYVVAVSERDPEAFSVASWISRPAGVVGAIAICGPTSRYGTKIGRTYGEMVREAARQISASLSGAFIDAATVVTQTPRPRSGRSQP